MSSSDDFLQQLRATFRIEAAEHLQVITAGLLRLEREQSQQERKAIVEEVFRAAHSLKGAARAVEFPEVESACQALEDTFAAWKRQESQPTPALLDQLHVRLTRVATFLGAATGSGVAPATAVVEAAAEPPTRPVPEGGGHAEEVTLNPPAAATATTVRVNVELLDARLVEAEEMLSVKLGAGQRVEELRELGGSLQAWRDAPVAAREQAPQLLEGMERKVAGLVRAAEQDRVAVAKLVDDLLANSKKLLLLPFATVAAPLPKLVRDLCRDQGKEADLQVEGDQTVLDKRVLDALKDPLIHLLRNCIDHGIELPEERRRRGKPPRAQIRLSVQQVPGDKVQITLTDDGAGIDSARVKAAALKHGVVTPETAATLDELQAQALVFRSAVSTSPMITQLSGRGLGLAIVQEKAASLGGEASVESRLGAGTAFRIVVPAMRATFRGILVQAGGRLLVAPTMQVDRVARARAREIQCVEGRDTISIAGRVLPVVRLAQVLDIEEPRAASLPAAGAPLVIVGGGDQRVAFVVDKVLDEQEFLVKPLSLPLRRVRNVASAAVLPNGQIAFVLHVGDLLQSARRRPTASLRQEEAPAAEAAPAKSILVAEDSITSRMLIKHILETAGYRVTTAIDGMEAFERLRGEAFDLVVSDVEMPRLNGFDLTARIRSESRLAETPVVLLTALETRQDRERGVDVGASAYIVKSSFDEGTLVDAVRRLL